MTAKPGIGQVEAVFSAYNQAKVRQQKAEQATQHHMSQLYEAQDGVRQQELAIINLIQDGAIDTIMQALQESQTSLVRRAKDAPQLKLCPPGTVVVANDGTIWERVGTCWTRLVRATDFRQDVNDEVNTATLLAEKKSVILTEPAYVYMFCNDADRLEGQPHGRVAHSIEHGPLVKEDGEGYYSHHRGAHVSSESLARQGATLWESPMLILPAEVDGVKEVD